ncbi:MAG: GNAT family N-acetyltransferase [Ruminococcaceae bacterium]|nr:GNAT family N-acetyltransferase [Oscillospiraceae bacterium]
MNYNMIQQITKEYYSHFCGTDFTRCGPGIHFVCMPARDEVLKGFGCKYTVYVLAKNEITIVSYAPKHRDWIEKYKGLPVDEIMAALKCRRDIKTMQLFAFEEEKVRQFGDAKILTPSDYPLYDVFFRESNPEADPAGWLHEYFTEKAEKGLLAGYYKEGRLVSVCDAPDMPYMEGKIQHTGIMTLKTERGKGYAKCAAALATHHLIENGICPQWECDFDNVASTRLAQSIGYVSMGQAYILEEL